MLVVGQTKQECEGVQFVFAHVSGVLSALGGAKPSATKLNQIQMSRQATLAFSITDIPGGELGTSASIASTNNICR